MRIIKSWFSLVVDTIKIFVKEAPGGAIILLFGLLMIVYSALFNSPSDNKERVAQLRTKFRLEERQLPPNGHQRDYLGNEGGNKTTYEFDVPSPGWNTLIRFFNLERGALAADLFVHRGTKKSFISLVPGTYKIVYAYGCDFHEDVWFGDKILWGSMTRYGESRNNSIATGEKVVTKWNGRYFESSMWRSCSEDRFGKR